MVKITSTRAARKAPAKAQGEAKRKVSAIKRSTRKGAVKAAVKGKRKVTTRKPSKAAKAGKPNARRKAAKVNRGGGKALNDFGNDFVIRIVKGKGKDIARSDCFRTGQTVSANIKAQGTAGYKGRRKYIRAQKAQGRITLSAR